MASYYTAVQFKTSLSDYCGLRTVAAHRRPVFCKQRTQHSDVRRTPATNNYKHLLNKLITYDAFIVFSIVEVCIACLVACCLVASLYGPVGVAYYGSPAFCK